MRKIKDLDLTTLLWTFVLTVPVVYAVGKLMQ